MNLKSLSTSESFFNYKEPLAEAGLAEFGSLRGRKMAIFRFFKQLGMIPVSFMAKLFRTFTSILGLGFAVLLLVLTLCCESGIRGFFVKQIMSVSKELADWVLWPPAILFCLGRLLLAATVHPALYFGV